MGPDQRTETPSESQRSATSSGSGAPSVNRSELRRRVYEFSDLSKYSLSQRLMIRGTGLLTFWCVLLIGLTVRWSVVGWDHYRSIRRQNKRIIFTFWHNCIFLATWFWRHRGIVVMSSQSFDSEYIARFIQRFGYGAARGSSTRGGQRAIKQMVSCLTYQIDTAFTIDGPRGPRYVAKPGAVRLAKLSGEAVLPFHISARRFWELKSWDRVQIPYPFTRAVILLGKPILVSPGSSSQEVEERQAELQARLDQLREQGDQWWRTTS